MVTEVKLKAAPHEEHQTEWLLGANTLQHCMTATLHSLKITACELSSRNTAHYRGIWSIIMYTFLKGELLIHRGCPKPGPGGPIMALFINTILSRFICWICSSNLIYLRLPTHFLMFANNNMSVHFTVKREDIYKYTYIYIYCWI